MDQSQTRAIEALQPFIALANSSSASSPRFVANIITNATSNPHTFVFAELLETAAVQALRSPETPAEYQSYLTLLEIFAWGTWQDYHETPNLPELSPAQTLKLRLLTLLTLSSTSQPLTYDALMRSLSLTVPSDLESLVTTAIYSSLISARLAPASIPPTVNVSAIAPLRDVNPQSLPNMINILAQWETRCGDVISDIEAEIAKIKSESAKRRAKEHARTMMFEQTLAAYRAEAASAAGGGEGPAAGGAARKHWGQQHMYRGGGLGGNKREFIAEEFDDDDGYWEHGSELDLQAMGGSRMDIDEGAGSGRAGAAGARHPKRILGKKS
ncbi:COP9 signalosome subunit 7 [Aspergillus saccharolyticus JOP 1030-1]|uniref:COP9 signalosome subunit 7 n=1 Tax=Aspergillus saccharolyticus JOP 1030-1 TaxID=1450539 RepID=A0A318ZPN6_9EURO|nr:COP9 signalosome subunit 7 [Aspergillus saccharolyticus JOP 1030-1]PYH42078.1 COP9 signalosome subunit 7 [Aspergillus saccharolyticus JOP 1030-1]